MYDEEDDEDCTTVASRAELTAALAAKKEQQQRPWIIVVAGSGAVGRTYRLDGELTVGRSMQAAVHLDQDGVSRIHAKFVATPEGGVDLCDMGSRNGTFVNGERIARHSLRDGDKIQIGTTTILKFSYQDALDEALQRNLYESATRDPLTGLANKKMFADALDREFSFAKRHRRPLSVVAFDIDHFKRINDTFGHPAGDYVLQTLAKVVSGCVRTEDVVGRVGGEEFTIVLRDTVEKDAVDCAERVRRTLESTEFVRDGKRIPVTVSMGVAALSHDEHGSQEQLIALADQRLYRAKEGGRNRVVAGTVSLVGLRAPAA